MSANSGHVIGTISEVALSFMVHDPERDHRAIERQVAVAQASQVAEHLVFAVVPVEHRLGQELVGAASGRRKSVGHVVDVVTGDGEPPSAATTSSTSPHGGRLVEGRCPTVTSSTRRML